MIVVKIKSGLGNQMFQYALGRRLSLDWKGVLKCDLSWFSNIKSNETPRGLEIDRFNIKISEASVEDIRSIQGGFVVRTSAKLLEGIRSRLNKNRFFHFYPSLLKKKSFVYLDGYYQSYKYFNSIRNVLLNDFVLKNGYSTAAKIVKDEIEDTDQSIAIHVRRGDYVSTCKDWNGLCGVEYYKKGVEAIRASYSNVKLFIFSDDIQWAQENLKFADSVVFVSSPVLNSVEELVLMSLCKHQIIANSTFSWWAAWLNQNVKKIVIAPSRWLLVADIDTSDLLPQDWLRI